LTVGWLKEQSN